MFEALRHSQELIQALMFFVGLFAGASVTWVLMDKRLEPMRYQVNLANSLLTLEKKFRSEDADRYKGDIEFERKMRNLSMAEADTLREFKEEIVKLLVDRSPLN